MILRDLMAERRSLENPAMPLTNPALLEALGGESTWAGKGVTPKSAMAVSAVFRSTTLIADTIGTLPVHLFRRLDRGRERVKIHRLLGLMQNPNAETAGDVFWSQIEGYKLLRGNGFAWIQYDGRGREEALWQLPSERVEIVRTPSRQLAYLVRPEPEDGVPLGQGRGEFIVPAGEMLHFRNFGFGQAGISVLSAARQAIASSLAAEEYGARFFANDARPGGFLTVPATLPDKVFNRLMAQWSSLHQGAKNAHMMGLLEAGVQWQNAGLTNEDAQFLETRRWQISDIARFFGVFPWMIGDVEKTTSWGTGIEVQGIGFVVYTLRSRLVRNENEFRRKLLTQEGDEDLYPLFIVDGLLRGDQKARYEAYGIARQWGWLSVNDILLLEDRDPIGPEGDIYLQPANMVPAGTELSKEAARMLDLLGRLTPDSIGAPKNENGGTDASEPVDA